MTPEERQARTEYLRAVVEGRLQHRTYWLTRNRTDGELDAKVDVWLTEPHRVPFEDGDVHWIGLTEIDEGSESGGTSTHYGRWTTAQARDEVGNGIPVTDRECLRVGGSPRRAQA